GLVGDRAAAGLPDVLGDPLHALDLDVGERDLHAELGRRPGEPLADAAAGTGDDGDAAAEDLCGLAHLFSFGWDRPLGSGGAGGGAGSRPPARDGERGGSGRVPDQEVAGVVEAASRLIDEADPRDEPVRHARITPALGRYAGSGQDLRIAF